MRWSLAAVAVALVLCGCGTVGKRDAARAPLAELEPAPPITAVDEPAPDGVLWFLDARSSWPSTSDGDGGVHVYCDYASSGDQGQSQDGDGSCPPMTPEQEAQARVQQKEWEEAVRPAPDSTPRTIAKLALSRGGTVLLIVWRNKAGDLCTDVEEESPDGSGGGGGPAGPCLPQNPTCGEICVESGGDGDLDDLHYTLTGFVPSEGDSVRVTLGGGAVRSYPLNGPVVEGTGRRVLMLELGPHDWRRVEVFRGDRLVAAQDLPAEMAAFEDCEERAGPMPMPESEDDPGLNAYEQRIEECLRATMPTGLDLPAVPVHVGP